MDLFSHQSDKDRRGQPLAERMRPTSLQDYVGQEHLLGPGKLLARLATGGRLPSLILWGPPGTGKTTLARIVASQRRADFAQLSAVQSGVKDIRAVVARAQTRRDQYGYGTILFIDEIHRFSKSQQDALLPHVEAGTVVLIGATTENPSFEVNAPLLSRCRVLRLEPLSDEAIRALVARALSDRERGLGTLGVTIADEVTDQLIERSAGDARRALNALEVAALIAAPGTQDGTDEGTEGGDAPGTERVITEDILAEALQQKTLLYDKAGDEHYSVVSALIKSMRGTDPDAAAYWMARMLEAGEDPRFVLRRLVIFASEDVGNADPQALVLATSALAAYEFVGMPEGVLPLTQLVTYLACAPKSNTALTTYAAARRLVREHGALPVPDKLRNATTAMQKKMGHGQGYKYPHNFDGHYVDESYLPEQLEGETLYEPSESGAEAAVKERLARLRGGDD